jgi:hypothetical protein
MSTAPPPAPAPVVSQSQQEIKIVSHSNIFYWWPVWAVGFLMFLLTYFDGTRVAVVPDGTEARRNWEIVTGSDTDGKKVTESHEGYILERGKHLMPNKPVDQLPKPDEPHLRMASHATYGVVFATTLLLVIVITNVPLRGLWSWIVIIGTILVVVILALAGVWDTIFHYVSLLDIRINAGGYLFISTILFGIWLMIMLVFDRNHYMIFTPGQLKVCEEVGSGETAYDTMGMVTQKERSDLFRHIILGLGSGDLVVRTSGANFHEFRLPNVLFVSRKLQQIEDMQRDRPVVRGSA